MQESQQPLIVKLIDFQICRSGSVVSDLSYLLYSAVTKNILDDLDHFLKIYHDSFSDTLRSYNLDPSAIFTFADLKAEWKNHFAYGYIISQVLWANKLMKAYDKRNFVELEENGIFEWNNDEQSPEKYELDVEKLDKILMDLTLHVNENGWL